MSYTRILYLNWTTQSPNSKTLPLRRVVQLQPWLQAQGHHCFGDDAGISQELFELQKTNATVTVCAVIDDSSIPFSTSSHDDNTPCPITG